MSDSITSQLADNNALSLLSDFSSRVVVTEGQAVGNSEYIWHRAPDGGAVFEDKNVSNPNGWIYVPIVNHLLLVE